MNKNKLAVSFLLLLFISACSTGHHVSSIHALEATYNAKLISPCDKTKVHLERLSYGMKIYVTANNGDLEHKEVKKISLRHGSPNLVVEINKMLKKSCIKVLKA